MQKPKPGYKLVKSVFGKEIEIPIDWNVDEIQNHAKITTGTKNTQDKIDNGKYPFFVRSQKIERIHSFSYDGEAVLTAGDGVGTGKVFHYINGKFDFHQRVYKISDFDNLLNGYFFYLFFSNYFFDRAMSMTAKASVDSIRMNMIAKMPLLLPPIKEQQKIAHIISNVDNLIEKYDSIIDSTKVLKTGLMQQLLTKGIGHKKFKEISLGKIPFEWESSIIGDCSKIGTGGTPSRNNVEYFQGNIPWVKTTEIRYNIITETEEKISKTALDKTSTKLYPKNTLLFAMYGQGITRGKCAILGIEAAINQACAAIIPNTTLDTWFLFYWLQFYYEKIRTLSSGSHQSNFNLDLVKKLEIGLPSMNEQKKIVTMLNSVDNNISKIKSEKSNLEKIKKGLMQKLLTGQIRVEI